MIRVGAGGGGGGCADYVSEILIRNLESFLHGQFVKRIEKIKALSVKYMLFSDYINMNGKQN